MNRGDLITSQLFEQEAVEGRVVVERLDHVIAITPGAGTKAIILEALRFGIADDIEPVPRPAFAVVRTDEQAFHELFVSVSGRVVDEGGDFLGRRRQARKIEAEPTDECRA